MKAASNSDGRVPGSTGAGDRVAEVMSERRASLDCDELDATALRAQHVSDVVGIGLDSHSGMLVRVAVARDMDDAVTLSLVPDDGAHFQRLLRETKLTAPVRKVNDEVAQDPPLARIALRTQMLTKGEVGFNGSTVALSRIGALTAHDDPDLIAAEIRYDPQVVRNVVPYLRRPSKVVHLRLALETERVLLGGCHRTSGIPGFEAAKPRLDSPRRGVRRVGTRFRRPSDEALRWADISSAGVVLPTLRARRTSERRNAGIFLLPPRAQFRAVRRVGGIPDILATNPRPQDGYGEGPSMAVWPVAAVFPYSTSRHSCTTKRRAGRQAGVAFGHRPPHSSGCRPGRTLNAAARITTAILTSREDQPRRRATVRNRARPAPAWPSSKAVPQDGQVPLAAAVQTRFLREPEGVPTGALSFSPALQLLRAPRVRFELTTLRLTAGCSAD